MDMQLDPEKIRTERERRGWSQEHLASLTGLSPRTIQRVEAAGIASSETATALAAVFEVDLDALRPTARTKRRWGRALAAAVASGALVTVGALISVEAQAAQLLMDVGLTVGDQAQRPSQVITKDGKAAEIQIDGAWRVSVLPTLRPDGTIGLGLQLYQYNGKDYVLVAHPLLVTNDNTDAEVRLGDTPDRALRVVIRPHKI
jgi:transcriptional regulator with XRE-family HTH domain